MTKSAQGQRSGLMAVPAFVLCLTALLAGCSGPEATEDGPYAAEFAQARNEAQSDFAREVLADDVITDAEYRESQQRYIDCLADGGVKAVVNVNGGYDFDKQLVGAVADLERDCSLQYIMSVEPLYYMTRANPSNEDYDALTVSCLQKQGVVADSFTKQDWTAIVTAFAAGGGAEAPASQWPTLPGGTPLDDPRVQQCWNAPTGK